MPIKKEKKKKPTKKDSAEVAMQQAEAFLKQAAQTNVVQHRFQHYRFELELDHNDNIDKFKESVGRMHLD